MQFAAAAALHGFDPWQVFTADPDERLLLVEMVRAAGELRVQELQALAGLIAERIGVLFGGGD